MVLGHGIEEEGFWCEAPASTMGSCTYQVILDTTQPQEKFEVAKRQPKPCLFCTYQVIFDTTQPQMNFWCEAPAPATGFCTYQVVFDTTQSQKNFEVAKHWVGPLCTGLQTLRLRFGPCERSL